MDRESRDTFDLLDEIEKTLALDTTPMTWPVGRGRDFLGTYDVASGGVRLLEGGGAKTGAAQQIDIADLAGRNPNLDVGAIKDELALVSEACKPFELDAFREGHLTPVYFGSALRNFGVGDLLEGLGRFAPPPRAQDMQSAQGRGGGAAHERLRVQDPGQHGSQPSRSHRLRAALLGQAYPRHEGEVGAHRQEHVALSVRSSSSRRIARWRTRPLPATSSAFPITAHCGSAIR